MKSLRTQLNLLSFAIIASLCSVAIEVKAQETVLPQLGSSAGDLITPEQEQQYGSYMLYQLRQLNYILDDPLIDT